MLLLGLQTDRCPRWLVFFESSPVQEARQWQGEFEEQAQAIGIAEHGTAGFNAASGDGSWTRRILEKNTSHLAFR